MNGTMAPQRSTFVTGLAIISMLIAAFLFVSDIVALVSYVELTSSSEYQMTMKLIQSYHLDSSTMLINSHWMIGASIVSVILSMGTMAASYALYTRKSWGRISYIIILGVQALYYVVSSIVGYYLAKSIVSNSAEVFTSSGLWAYGGLTNIIGMIIILTTSAFIIRKLSSENVRREFAASNG